MKRAVRRLWGEFVADLFGYINAPLHQRMHDHINNNQHSGFSTHRGAGKTDQISVGWVAWIIGQNPDVRIKIFKNTDREATKVVDAVRRMIVSPFYRAVFPHIIPDEAHWTSESIRVIRKQVGEKEPTLASYGIFGSYTGGRADIIVYDDIVDIKNAIQNPALRDKVKELYRTACQPMLKALPPAHARARRAGDPPSRAGGNTRPYSP